MTQWYTFAAAIVWLLHIAVIARALVAAGRDPYSRTAWVLLLLTLPLVGVVLYFLFGEPWVSKAQWRRWRDVSAGLAAFAPPSTDRPDINGAFANALRTFEGASGWPVASGNKATLAADSDAAIGELVSDIDAAKRSVHLSFYIWLGDSNGAKVAEAVCRAARRGVRCRIAADSMGSSAFIRSDHWKQMRMAGAQVIALLPAPLGLGLLAGRRADLRNHRKICVIDGNIAHCGSQNCADPAFAIKAAYAPWVDIMLRLQGPVVRQLDLIFAQAWSVETSEEMGEYFASCPPDALAGGFPAIAAGTGPLTPHGTMSEMFVGAITAARTRVCITTPYFAPDPPLAAAIVAAARRGVEVRIIFPHRNDSRIVAAISRAYYPTLAEAGVRIFEFRGGLLHAKTLVADDRLVLIGSSNMDRRSLDLNFENNVLIDSSEIAALVGARQEQWMANCMEVPQAQVCNRALARRLADNLLTLVAPVF